MQNLEGGWRQDFRDALTSDLFTGSHKLYYLYEREIDKERGEEKERERKSKAVERQM